MISRTELANFKKKFDVVSAFIDHDGETLLLHRQDHKPQGNTWAMCAGKVDKGEELLEALVREIQEEVGILVNQADARYFEGYYVRYPEYDYVYHVYHVPLQSRPTLVIREDEHKDYRWIRPADALLLPLITYEDLCIKWFYGVERPN